MATRKYFVMTINATKGETIQIASGAVVGNTRAEFFSSEEDAMKRAEETARAYKDSNQYVVMTGVVTAMVEAVPVTPPVRITVYKQ